MLLGTSLSLIISACASVPDVPVCARINESKGWCTYTITEKEFFVDNDKQLMDGKKWSEVEAVSLRVPAKSWAEIKGFILKMCKQNNGCAENIGTWERKTSSIDAKVVGK